jgi:hypothetical protein
MKTALKCFAVGSLLVFLVACGGGAEEATAVPTAAPVSAAATTAPTVNSTAAPVEPIAAPVAETQVEATEVPAEPTAAPQAREAAAPSGDAQEAVWSALRAQLAGGPYRMISTVEAEGTISEMTAEVIPPNTMHMIINAEGGNTEMI